MLKSSIRKIYAIIKVYDSNNNIIYGENSKGYWYIYEYDSNNNRIYSENIFGIMMDNR